MKIFDIILGNTNKVLSVEEINKLTSEINNSKIRINVLWSNKKCSENTIYTINQYIHLILPKVEKQYSNINFRQLSVINKIVVIQNYIFIIFFIMFFLSIRIKDEIRNNREIGLTINKRRIYRASYDLDMSLEDIYVISCELFNKYKKLINSDFEFINIGFNNFFTTNDKLLSIFSSLIENLETLDYVEESSKIQHYISECVALENHIKSKYGSTDKIQDDIYKTENNSTKTESNSKDETIKYEENVYLSEEKYSSVKYDDDIKKKCLIKTNSGLMVQSNGEKAIANFLDTHNIGYDYDSQITLKGNEPNRNGYVTQWIRPDFYLTELDIIIEYWGMKGTSDYDEKMETKKRLYKEANKRFISVMPEDIKNIEQILKNKLDKLGLKIDNIKPEIEKKLPPFKCNNCGHPMYKIGNGFCLVCNTIKKREKEKQQNTIQSKAIIKPNNLYENAWYNKKRRRRH